MIARALGARVYRNPVKEIGWFPVRWTDEAAEDPLFAALTEPAIVFRWHGETFDLLPGAVLLARSEACAHQAFGVGSNVSGLQFHLEVTPQMISEWLAQEVNCGDVCDLTAPIDPALNTNRQAELSLRVFSGCASTLVSG